MVLVDSSVWIDYFNGKNTATVEKLKILFHTEVISTGDLILAELLQGFKYDRDAKRAADLLLNLTFFEMFNGEIALTAADCYRFLRKKGYTVRSSVDIWIAIFCIQNQIKLLHSDKDYVIIKKYFDLKTV